MMKFEEDILERKNKNKVGWFANYILVIFYSNALYFGRGDIQASLVKNKQNERELVLLLCWLLTGTKVIGDLE